MRGRAKAILGIIGVLIWAAVSCSKREAAPQGEAKPEAGPPAATNRAQPPAQAKEEAFIQWMNTGKNYYDNGDAKKAVEAFEKAGALYPARVDARLNLANACLAAGDAQKALEHALKALEYDRNSAAAYYVAGCAYARLQRYEEAVKMFFTCRDLDPGVAAVSFQLGRAQQALGRVEDAIAAYRRTVQIETNHPSAHYFLGQLLVRSGRQQEGLKELEIHRRLQAKRGGAPLNPASLERCKFTEAVAPTKIVKPDPQGIPVRFVDVTTEALGDLAMKCAGPIAVLDYNRDDRNSLFVTWGTNGFRLLDNRGGKFKPLGPPLKARYPGPYRQILVGDLNNDRFEDALVVGEKGSQLFRYATNGLARDATVMSGLKRAKLEARSALLMDMDFTGKLDILAVLADGSGLRALRNLGNMYFKDVTSTSGLPARLPNVRQIAADDWNNDDMLDLLVSREGARPACFQKVRGGPFVLANLPPGELEGAALTTGDINGDARTDLLVSNGRRVDVLLGGVNQFLQLPLEIPEITALRLADYDNDGWLDLIGLGRGLRVFRNVGDGRFADVTSRLGLDVFAGEKATDLAAADLDRDGDTDFAVALEGKGLRLLRNEGGNANKQIKLRLVGNRSNASGLGIRIEAAIGSFKIHRTVSSLPVEIGVGPHDKIDSLVARWFDLPYNIVDVAPSPDKSLVVFEPTLPTGSCPYLYVWDGEKFRFVADFLGGAPLGLRVSDTVFCESNPHELLWLGDESDVRPKEGRYVVQITDELREALYLDESKLVAADHPEGTEVCSTDKLLPGRPFPPSEVWTLERPIPLRHAERPDGTDVTDLLRRRDRRFVSPERLRVPQLRGLAEPFSVILDFGPLPVEEPLVLLLSGWLHWGGGMANVAASHNPDLPFPFPRLEVETEAGQWRPVKAVVGAPAGKYKTILVDLRGKLPPHSRRLRLTTAYEIHWDRAALFRKRAQDDTRVVFLAPVRTDLHWRGFSRLADLSWQFPETPVYEKVFQDAPWAIQPMGWCTRYGPVDELVAEKDNAFALVNSGDELTLEFPADRLPPKPPGMKRDFFIYNVGWDKDSDFHVELGWKVEPLPWHGMNDQLYGKEPRPAFPNDDWIARYNTRWVGLHPVKRSLAAAGRRR